MANSLDVFNTKCSSIITRMIDAVPAGVKLTEVITPTLVKPDGIKLLRNSDNSFNLFGRVRVCSLPPVVCHPGSRDNHSSGDSMPPALPTELSRSCGLVLTARIALAALARSLLHPLASPMLLPIRRCGMISPRLVFLSAPAPPYPSSGLR